ncbi:prepilin-type N-terminal cleavage/methylation domain-containing protein [Bacillus sp. V3B]|uniref:type IV pilus modification PilV family protein n=1 Tax=Bacillus sp. V3B TaxID=2804915 RepID=UPI00210C44D4|nr:prepilin-type N-terminal cleavage/methylation domain-containing protein [Bacillus sp. V3B]MCQ6273511.1 prepilin-type N-terminal cleavage/methylation domain-containing protein [Bacillus sp. V3B]
MIHHNQKGVTLLEVLLSIVILTIILVSIMNLLPQMGFMNKQNEDKQQAINLAKKELIYWQGTLESSNFTSFKGNPEQDYPFIEEDDIISTNIDTIIIETDTTGPANSIFNVEVIIQKDSDLDSEPIKAYPLHIKLFKNKGTLVSETYGYVFYEG